MIIDILSSSYVCAKFFISVFYGNPIIEYFLSLL